jgi:hypothetical protein
VIQTRVVALLIVLAASTAGAQGALSTQGFGYPQGQFSTRALATGGGLAQFDPQSGVNPASIASSGDPLLFLQYEPEFRRLTADGPTQHSTTSRFPMAIASLPILGEGTIALSVSTLLDRSWSTSVSRQLVVAGDTATATENTKSLGAIDDVRLAGGWVPNSFLQLGLAGHVFTGQNRLYFQQLFPDSLHFVPVQQASGLDYTGFAVSAGVILHPASALAIAFSGRKGGTLKARSGDTIVTTANIPDRFGAGISYAGITGATISAQIARDQWSAMNGLGSDDAKAVDAWDGGFGLEATGPRIIERTILLRLGARYRTLPFVAAGSEVREISFAGGLGAQFSRNRAAFDVTVQRASRSADGGTAGSVREQAYTLSFGLRVRP